jgi:tetratricopeptide (TPR) repeat protein
MKKKVSLLIIFFLITSCAGFITRGAQDEFDKGLALFNRGLYQEAIIYFEKAIEIDPEFAQPYLYLGRSYLNLKQWVEAVQPLRTAFRLSPEDSKKEIVTLLIDALFGTAVHEIKQGNLQTSISLFKEVFSLQKQSDKSVDKLTENLILLGRELLLEGKTIEAITVYNEAVQVAPHNASVYIGLARALLKNGDVFKAVDALKNALEIDPSNRDAQLLFKNILGM